MKNPGAILLPAVLCLLSLHSAAQPQAGIKAGLNYAGLSGYQGDNLVSFHAGAFVQITMNENWRIQPELLYSCEGQHYLVYDNEDPGPVENTIALNYIQLPLIIQYFPLHCFYIEAGPQLGVLTSAYSKGIGDGHMNIKRSFSNAQFGLGLGAGYLFNRQFVIYTRYCFGLTDITPYNNIMNQSYTGQLGIAFRFANKSSRFKSKGGTVDIPEH